MSARPAGRAIDREAGMGILEGKVAVITGAGRGIGRGEALLFASEGARVVVNDLGGEWDGSGSDPRPATHVVEEIQVAGGEAVAHFDDISEEEGADSLIRLALDTWGRLDAVVNNAGILRDRMVFNMAVEEWDAVMKVHLRGHFLVTRAACRHWRDRSKAGEDVRGAIVNTTSTSGILGNAGQSNYGAAKAGIAAFSSIVAMEMQRYGVTVNAIAPGARTRMTEKTFGDLALPEGEFDALAPENIAPLVACLASDAAAGITGQVFGVQGGLVQLYQGWTPVAEIHRDERWEPAQLAEDLPGLFGDRPTVYSPARSPLREVAGIKDGARTGARRRRGRLMATYFAGVTLFDGRTVRRKAGVLVDGARIEWVGAHARAPRPAAAADPVDGAGLFLTPGLIDCHVHLCFDGGANFLEEARVTEAYAAIKCVRNGERHLAAGVTTVRDLGGLGAVVCEVAKALSEGRIRGPRVVASGQALTITGGHGWNTFARQVDGADGVRLAVREQLRSGARSIKIVATGGVLTPGVTFDFTAFTPEEVEAAVDEAHTWGVPIAAHAIGAEGIASCVRAGIDSIEHGAQISADSAKLMKERGIFHVPTISALDGIVGNPETVPAYAVEKGRAVLEFARETFRRVIRTGVRHACGTDAGTPFNPHGGAPRELMGMIEWGLAPLKALVAATANAAELLRVPSAGTVDPGKAADVVLWPGDPIEDPSILLSPRAVFQSGQLVSGAP